MTEFMTAKKGKRPESEDQKPPPSTYKSRAAALCVKWVEEGHPSLEVAQTMVTLCDPDTDPSLRASAYISLATQLQASQPPKTQAATLPTKPALAFMAIPQTQTQHKDWDDNSTISSSEIPIIDMEDLQVVLQPDQLKETGFQDGLYIGGPMSQFVDSINFDHLVLSPEQTAQSQVMDIEDTLPMVASGDEPHLHPIRDVYVPCHLSLSHKLQDSRDPHQPQEDAYKRMPFFTANLEDGFWQIPYDDPIHTDEDIFDIRFLPPNMTKCSTPNSMMTTLFNCPLSPSSLKLPPLPSQSQLDGITTIPIQLFSGPRSKEKK